MAEKKSKNKKVLVASMILAAMIVASSSFAWFTSQDEVVNKLTANGQYAVTVTEDFTPPPEWIPGQVVNKAAGAINTGNVDAFVKLTLSNSLVLTNYGTPEAFDESKVSTYVELDDAEVISLQAGGRLVCEAGTTITAEANKLQGTGYRPSANGLYIFERVTDYYADGSVKTVEYAGYQYAGGKYYALASIEHTVDTNANTDTFSAKVQTKQTQTVTPDLVYDSAENKIVATYGAGDNQIKVNINLDAANAANWTNYGDNDDDIIDFYYNKILRAGTETGNLVKSIELDSSVKSTAYITMDYNLKVAANSVQVTNDTDKTTAVNAEWGTPLATVGTDGTVTWS